MPWLPARSHTATVSPATSASRNRARPFGPESSMSSSRPGRRQLADLGERVVLAPKLAGGFGIADLIAGRSLVEIKTVLEPAGRFEQWLNQLLGYVLLDWYDTFRLDTVAVYLGWQAKLMAISLTDLLTIASHGQAPPPEYLRGAFRQAIQADLDLTAEVQLRKQYPRR
jgi:hypothetical protein